MLGSLLFSQLFFTGVIQVFRKAALVLTKLSVRCDETVADAIVQLAHR
jgi:hypothetical protein